MLRKAVVAVLAPLLPERPRPIITSQVARSYRAGELRVHPHKCDAPHLDPAAAQIGRHDRMTDDRRSSGCGFCVAHCVAPVRGCVLEVVVNWVLQLVF